MNCHYHHPNLFRPILRDLVRLSPLDEKTSQFLLSSPFDSTLQTPDLPFG